ncbi:hypothetical protein H6801_01855 [Candidatus Nomurabacteria bacterium]|nr:hypothetical protein [Candidatus Nomurabacteria bacterium]
MTVQHLMQNNGQAKGREAVALGRIAAAGRTHEQDVRDNRMMSRLPIENQPRYYL